MSHSIFILDDDTKILELTKCNLESIDHVKIHLFSDPVQALHAIYNEGIPDLIITDLLMPEMNGLEFLAKITQKGPPPRALLFTGQPEKVPDSCIYPVIRKDINAFQLLHQMVVTMLQSA
jgi:DNA-binding NtrC family response regulator